MRLSHVIWVWFSLLGWVAPVHAQKLTLGPQPSWVLSREATAASVTPFDGPVTYLLVDRQDSFVGPVPQFYFRLSARINNPAGLDELSQVTADFDPAYERLIFHGIRITRDGATRSMPLKPESFELIRREKDSERQIFDGTLTASYLVHDLRVGDIVEYAYSVAGQHPLFGKKYSGRHDLNWNVPVLEAQIRQIWPTDARTHWTVNRPDISIQQKVEGRELITLWTGRKLQPRLEEDLVPTWVDPMDTYTFSSWQDWADVVNWALPFYQLTAASEAAVTAEARRIQSLIPQRRNQVEEAIRFVQDEVRYVGIEMGSGSFVPRQPAEVLQKRFGDCKDKTLLLASLIQKLGYEAFPILVRSEGGQSMDKLPATPLAFNHVIVGVKDPEKPGLYWVDGTLQNQGTSLESRDYPNLFQGLPLRKGSQELLRQDTSLTPMGRIEYDEHYAVSAFTEPVILTIKSRFTGWQAEKMRNDLATQGSAVLSDTFANYVKKIYPDAGIQLEPVFHDDRGRNELTVEESYQIPALWQERDKGAWRLDVQAGAYIHQYLAQPQKVKRTQAVSLAHPLTIVHRQAIDIPEEWSVADARQDIGNDSFSYSLQQNFKDGVLTFVHTWTSKADQVKLADLPAYLRDAESVRHELSRFVTYAPKPSPSIWERFSIAFPQILGLFILFLVAIGWRLQHDSFRGGTMIWPRRSLPFMLVMLILSSGAFALFWYADADRRMRQVGRRLLPTAGLWLSIGIFAAALASRGIQILIEPGSFQKVPWPMLAAVILLHGLWAFVTLRLLNRDFPQLQLNRLAAYLLGPLYFQAHMQNLQLDPPAPDVVPEVPRLDAPAPLLDSPQVIMHPTEEGDEPLRTL